MHTEHQRLMGRRSGREALSLAGSVVDASAASCLAGFSGFSLLLLALRTSRNAFERDVYLSHLRPLSASGRGLGTSAALPY